MIELRTLGTLALRDTTKGLELHSLVAQPKRVALLAYLAIAKPRGFHRRDTLLGIFWPDSTEARARAALSQAVYTLRRMLGENVVVTRGDEEVAVAEDALWCDAVEFERALDAGDRARAFELYGGDLLKGFFLAECIEFDQWLHGERTRLRERAVQAAWSLVDEHEAGGNRVEAAHWARRAVALAPDDEPSVARLIALLAAAGDRAAALREYEAFERRMRELELDVSRATRELAERIRRADDTAPAEIVPQPMPARAIVPPAAAAAVVAPLPQPQRTASPRRRYALFAVAAVALLAIAGAVALRNPRASDRPLFSEKRVLVAEFTNETGDQALAPLGRVTADWIAQALHQSGLVEVVPAVTAMRSAQAMDIALEAPTAVINRTLAEETGAGILVSGAYYKESDRLIIHARITEARTGTLLRGLDPISGPASQPMAVVDQLRRRALGALASLTDQRLAAWSSTASQPPSFEAYQLYAEALDEFFRNDAAGYRNSAVRFREAAALDSTFTAPLLWATFAYINVEEHETADSLIRIVERSRPRLAAWDRAMLAYQQALIRGTEIQKYNAARRVVELAPQSEWRFLLAQAAIGVNRPGEAATILRGVDPDRGWIRTWPTYWVARSTAEHFIGDFREELATLRRGRLRHPHTSQLELFQLRALGALGMLNQGVAFADSIGAAGADPATILDAYIYLSRELRIHNDPAAAVTAAMRGLERVPQAGSGRGRFLRGLLLAEAGRWQELYDSMESLPLPGTDGSNLGLRAVAAARLGKRDEALAAAESLSRMEPDTTRLQPLFLRGRPQLWAAGVHAHLGDRARAMDLLRAARSAGVSLTGRGIHGNVGLAPLQGYRPFEELIRPEG